MAVCWEGTSHSARCSPWRSGSGGAQATSEARVETCRRGVVGVLAGGPSRDPTAAMLQLLVGFTSCDLLQLWCSPDTTQLWVEGYVMLHSLVVACLRACLPAWRCWLACARDLHSGAGRGGATAVVTINLLVTADSGIALKTGAAHAGMTCASGHVLIQPMGLYARDQH